MTLMNEHNLKLLLEVVLSEMTNEQLERVNKKFAFLESIENDR